MGQALMKRGEFATLAHVSPTAITKACNNGLAPAVVGNRIDAAHPCAQAYLREQQLGPTFIDPETGLDRFYYRAVQWCRETGRYSAQGIREAFQIGTDRATEIYSMMRVSGEVPAAPSTPTAGGPVSSLSAVPVSAAVGGTGAGVALSIPMVANKPDTALTLVETEAIEIPEDIQSVADMSLRDLIARYGSNTRFSDWLSALEKLERIEEKRLKNAKTEGQLVARDLFHDGVIVHMDSTFHQLLTDGAKTIAQRLNALHDSGADQAECEELVRDQIQSFIKPMKKKMAAAIRNA